MYRRSKLHAKEEHRKIINLHPIWRKKKRHPFFKRQHGTTNYTLKPTKHIVFISFYWLRFLFPRPSGRPDVVVVVVENRLSGAVEAINSLSAKILYKILLRIVVKVSNTKVTVSDIFSEKDKKQLGQMLNLSPEHLERMLEVRLFEFYLFASVVRTHVRLRIK